MTECEAIKLIENEKTCLKSCTSGKCDINCRECKENPSISCLLEAFDLAIFALKEVKDFKELGDIASIRDAVRKQTPCKIRNIETFCFECPNCGNFVSLCDDWNTYKYCPNCGQALNYACLY